MQAFLRVQSALALFLALVQAAFCAPVPQGYTITILDAPNYDPSIEFPNIHSYDSVVEAMVRGSADDVVNVGDINVVYQPLSDPYLVSADCYSAVPPPPNEPSVINMNIPLLVSELGLSDWNDLFTEPGGMAALNALTDHEMAHVCIMQSGGPCYDPAVDPYAYICSEAAADNYANTKVCERAEAICDEIQMKKDELSDPPTQMEMDELDALGKDLDAECMASKMLRDKWNNERGAEALCASLMNPDGNCEDELAANNATCPENVSPGAPDNPPNPDGTFGDGMSGGQPFGGTYPNGDEIPDSCDYPKEPKPEVLPKCDKCKEDGTGDCDCESEEEDPPEDIEPDPVVGVDIHGRHAAPDFITHLALRHSLDFRTGEVLLYRNEVDPVDQARYKSSFSIPVSYSPQLIAARGSHDIYVMGRDDVSQVWTLERLYVQKLGGRYKAVRAESQSGIGVPVSPSAASVSIVGGNFVAPTEDESLIRSRRVTLWSAAISEITNPKSLVADPEGRYAMIIDTGGNRVVQLVPGNPASTIDVYVGSPTVNLAYARSMDFYDSTSMGRVAVISFDSRSAVEILMISDSNNDGIFESQSVMTGAQFKALGYHTSMVYNYGTEY